MTDDQRATGTLDVMPRTREWFADDGVLFEQAFATTPQCCPSRASIFSGRYSHNHGVLNNTPGWAEELDQDLTLQRYLSDHGYTTAYLGKYLNSWPATTDPPHFDEWAIFSEAADYYIGGDWNIDGDTRIVDTYYTDFIRDEALRFLRSHREREEDQPWLLFVAPTAPHAPFLPATRHARAPVPPFRMTPAIAEHGKAAADKPFNVRNRQKTIRVADKERTLQLRTLMSVDELVDDVMRDLDRSGELDNTLAIFMSDNGYLWRDHGIIGKSTPYTGSTQIPLLMRWPGHVDAGTTSRSIVANIDIAPTILQAAGIDGEPIVAMDGRSLLDAIAGRDRSRILLEHEGVPDKGIAPWASIRTARYQYTEYYDRDTRRLRSREYYDLRVDPWQLENLLGDDEADNDPNIARLHDRLLRFKKCAATNCP